MRLLRGGLISIFARSMSWAAGPGSTGLWALGVDGWVAMICKRREGPLEDAGMWASSPHTTQSGSARSRMGPHLRMPV